MTGVLIDNAADSVKNLIPRGDHGREGPSLASSPTELLCSWMIPSIGDAGLEGSTIDLIRNMHRTGDLKMRVFAMIEGTVDNLDSMLAIGPETSDLLNVSSVKMYADGALGSRGAKLLHQYEDKHVS